MAKPTVLLDIDNTILDIDSPKKQAGLIINANYGEGAQEDFWKIYGEVKKELGLVDLAEIGMRFAKRRKSEDFSSAVAAFLELDANEYLLPSAGDLVKFLSANTNLVIFSEGHGLFQGQKVKKLGLDRAAKRVIITKSKIESLKSLAGEFSGPFILIDDNPEVISAAKKTLGNLTTIWVKFGAYSSGNDPGADFKTGDLSEVISYLRKIVGSS